MSEYYLVDVKSITSSVPRSEFKVDELENLAQSILTAGGLLSPLLLKQTGIESYEVLAGDREYYAAVRAKEINPRAAEMVNAFIVPEAMESAAVEQFAALHATQPTGSTGDQPPTDKTPPTSATPPSSVADQRLTNLESRLDEALREIKQAQQREVQRLEQEIKGIKEQIPAKVEPLEALNTLKTHELLQKLATANIKGKVADKIINSILQERKKAAFTSFKDAVERVDQLGEGRMLSIIDAWSGLY